MRKPLIVRVIFCGMILLVADAAPAQKTTPEPVKIPPQIAEYNPKGSRIALSPNEEAWLAQNHVVRVRVTSFPPYIFLAEGAEPKGIAIDYLKLIAERSGITFVFMRETRGYNQAIKGLIDLQGPDLIPCMVSRIDLKDRILFSKSYYVSPRVIFTRSDSPFISDISDLRGRKLAMAPAIILDELVRKYPDIVPQRVQFDQQALKAVSTGQADAYIGEITLASYLILEHGFSDLKVAAPSPLADIAYCFGTRSDWPELNSIINKALDTIEPLERSAIRSRYLSVRYEYGITPTDVLKWVLLIGGAAVGVVLIFVFWNRSLNSRVRKRTAEVVESEGRFRATFE
jgi:ABC-type amino acid transport substrate-binding protein